MVISDDPLAGLPIPHALPAEEERNVRRPALPIFCILTLILVAGLLLLSPISSTSTAHANQSGPEKNLQRGLLRLDRSGAQQTLATTTGVFTLKATQIVGTNAHMTFTDLGHPVLTFTASTISGFQLSVTSEGVAMTLSASGSVTTTANSIKTSLADFLATSKSFANPTDLFALVGGKTVANLVLNNVTLLVDTFIQADSIDLLQVTVSIS